jgi:DNA-binding NarL/FixJ family response regulator
MLIKMVLADDREQMLSAVRQILEDDSRIQIVGETSAFTGIMQMLADYKPDVLLFDLYMMKDESSQHRL